MFCISCSAPVFKGVSKNQTSPVNFDYLEQSPSLSDEQVFCSEQNSCLKGSCLTRGDKLEVCFYEGTNGNFCRSSEECQNKKCADRGDGLHVCMGNGKEGDFCKDSEDCEKGDCNRLGDVFGFCLAL